MSSSKHYPLPLVCATVGGAVAGAIGLLALQHFSGKSPWRNQRKGVGHRRFIGVDVGGTTISVGLVNEDGVIQGDVKSALFGDDHDPAVIVQRIVRLVHEALLSAGVPFREITAVGICTPGLLDFDRGVVKCTANLRGWIDVPLTDMLADALGLARCQVVLENDANTALLAEVWVGAAKGKRDVVLLTLGTGIGTGIMCGGHLVRGCKGEAGELGHMILVPDGREHGSLGVRGIFEGYASATAVVARATEQGIPPTSALHAQPITCADVFHHAARGDAFASKIVNETAKYLAIGCINCTRSFDPEVILFTGGMAQAGEQLLSEMRAQFAQYHWNIAPVTVELRVASSPSHAGLIGSAYAARAAIFAMR